MKDYIVELTGERQVIATATEKGMNLKNIDNLGYLSVSQMKEFFKWILDLPKDLYFSISFPVYFPLDAWGLHDDCFWKNMDEKVDTLCEFISLLSGPCIMLKFEQLPREPRHVLQILQAVSYRPNIRGLSICNDMHPSHFAHHYGLMIDLSDNDISNLDSKVEECRQAVKTLLSTNQLIAFDWIMDNVHDPFIYYFDPSTEFWKDAFAANYSVRSRGSYRTYSNSYLDEVRRNNQNHARTASLFHGVALDSTNSAKMDYAEQEAKALLYARISRCLIE